MNKEQLRDSYVAQGWEVEPVANWTLVSNIEGKHKYDVNVVSPDNKFFTAQVVVINDGIAGEEATPLGALEPQIETFGEGLRAFLDTKEGGQVFAIGVTKVYDEDAVAEVKAFMVDNTTQNYVVKKRNDVFTFQVTT